jgi:hypothetical protein
MAKNPEKQLEATRALMGALLRRPPKRHDEIKINKSRPKAGKKAKRKPKAKP